MTSTALVFVSPSEHHLPGVLEYLKGEWGLSTASLEPRSLTYYDTFDWRLYRKGGELTTSPEADGVRVVWRRLQGSTLHESWTGSPPATASDFPTGPFGEAIGAVIKMRRLLPQIEVRQWGDELSVLAGGREIAARIVIVRRAARRVGSDTERRLHTLVRLYPMPGYDRAAENLTEALERVSEAEPSETSELDHALAAFGQRAADYSSKIKAALDPGSSAVDATREILADLLDTMMVNEDGTRRDLDSEFLHDFRVAVRRTRSALGQIKGVFRRESINPFRNEFSWLGTLTGPTRDLDVYLLKLPEYQGGLSEATRVDLRPLADFLHVRQKQEQAKVQRGLRSRRYRELTDRWRAFLNGDDHEGERAQQLVLEVASRCIRRAHKRVIRKGSAITPESPTSKLHRLRIDCKKLRYLLEFFRSLYPAEEIGGLVSALKRLQDNLGDFNDYGVHQQMLTGFAQEMESEGLAEARTLEAMELMLAELEKGEAGQRQLFAERFAEFSAPATTGIFDGLFRRPVIAIA